MIGDPAEHVSKVVLRVDGVELLSLVVSENAPSDPPDNRSPDPMSYLPAARQAAMMTATPHL